MAADLTTTMDDLVECVRVALEGIDRPVCDSGTTVGPPVVGLAQCCDCGCADCGSGQVSAFLERVFPADGDTLQQATRVENCRPGVTAADITVVVTRCYPRIDETGNMPNLETTSTAADELNIDVATVWQALKCCGPKIVFRESAVDSDPDGGCSAFAVRVTVPVSLLPPAVAS